jgi:lipopolysaccharide transport system ATP-binding protein
MSDRDLAISVRGLSKAYTIAHNQVKHNTLAEAMLHRIRHPMHRVERETFWALQDISFDVRKGEVVGIIGRNGAGKSTLLKILSRITEPTAGQIDLYGRVGSLLEVGTGFHQELTGRENIFLNGAILGMRRKEIQRQFDAIVDFAGVSQFLDTPVKRYSSGMYVRLAFAVSAHLNPDILVIDEVLAVGDQEFQKKCLRKMKDVASGGRTVLFVSHQLQSIRGLCTRSLVLRKGSVQFAGDVEEGVRLYLEGLEVARAEGEPVSRRGSGEIKVRTIQAAKTHFDPGEPKQFRIELQQLAPFDHPVFLTVLIKDHMGNELLHCDSRLIGQVFTVQGSKTLQFAVHSPWLRPGEYQMDLAVCTLGGVLDHTEAMCTFTVNELLPYPAVSTVRPRGTVLTDFSITDQQSPVPPRFTVEATNA